MLLLTALVGVVSCASVPQDDHSKQLPVTTTSHPADNSDAIVKQLVDVPKNALHPPNQPPPHPVPGGGPLPGGHFADTDLQMNGGFDGSVIDIIRRYTHALSKRLYPEQVPMAFHMAPNKRREQLPPEDIDKAGYSPEAVGMLRELVKRVERYLQDSRHQGPQSPVAAHRPVIPEEEHPLALETDKDVSDLLKLVSAQHAIDAGHVEDIKDADHTDIHTDTNSGADAQPPKQAVAADTNKQEATSS